MSDFEHGRINSDANILQLQLPKSRYNFPSRFLSLADLLIALTEQANALDYDLIKPVLLAIPAFTSPFEFFRGLIDRYYSANDMGGSNIDQIKFKVLAVTHCWLEQPFAHADLLTTSFEKHMKKFLKQVIGEKSDFLTNIAHSIKVLLRRLVAETKQLELAHQLYQLRSTASLGINTGGLKLKENIHLPLSPSPSADNVRVMESPMSVSSPDVKGIEDRYDALYRDRDEEGSLTSSLSGGNLSNSVNENSNINNNGSELSGHCLSDSMSMSGNSQVDVTGVMIRSILAREQLEQEGKSEGGIGSASYSTVRLSNSISSRPAWTYEPSAGTKNTTTTATTSGSTCAPILDDPSADTFSTGTTATTPSGTGACGAMRSNNGNGGNGSRVASGPAGDGSYKYTGTNGCGDRDDASVSTGVMSGRSSRAITNGGGVGLVASTALTQMNNSVIQMYPHDKLAELLTIIESEIGWASLRHRELIDQLWVKEDLKRVHPDLGGALHLTKFILATDKRMSWFASEIIYYGVFVGPISDALEYFIKVAHSAYLRNNFNTFFQIMSSLGLPCIKHLKTGWCNVSRSKKNLFSEMAKVCSPHRNYAAYRKCYDATIGSPRIPCLQVFLKDVKMVDSLHPSLNEDGLIDVYKILYVWKVLTAAIPLRKCDTTTQNPQLDRSSEIPLHLRVGVRAGHHGTVRSVGYSVSVQRCDAGGDIDSIAKTNSYGSLLSGMAEVTESFIATSSSTLDGKKISRRGHRQTVPRRSPFEPSTDIPLTPGVTDYIKLSDQEGEDAVDISLDPHIAIRGNNTNVNSIVDTTSAFSGDISEHQFPSLVVQPSFEDACDAFRESLFEPIHNSAHTLAARHVVAHNLNYIWDQGSRSITIHVDESETETPAQDNRVGMRPLQSTNRKNSSISLSGKSSEILAAIFTPAEKTTSSSSIYLNVAGNGCCEKLFTLRSTDDELVELMWKIRRSTADLSNLWNDSKVASFAETGRLLLELCKAGLI